jgi:hypothetical protein
MADMTSLTRKVEEAAARRTARAAIATLHQKQADAPSKTGTMRATGRVLPLRRQGNSFITGIEFTSKIAVFLEKGTGPHKIESRGFGPLHFYFAKAGKAIDTFVVNHPGSKKHVGWFSKNLQSVWSRSLQQSGD